MTYKLKMSDIMTVTEEEYKNGSTRLLPKEDQIPKKFWDSNNTYNRAAMRLFTTGYFPKDFTMKFQNEFMGTPEKERAFTRFYDCHIKQFYSNHSHKIAGMAYVLYLSSEQCIQDLMFIS